MTKMQNSQRLIAMIFILNSLMFFGCNQQEIQNTAPMADEQPNNTEDPTDQNIIPDPYDDGALDYNKKPLGKEYPQGQYLEDPNDSNIIPD